MITVIGSAEAVLAGMFPSRYDAHVERWLKWRFLYQRGIVDKAGIVLEGRTKGRKISYDQPCDLYRG